MWAKSWPLQDLQPSLFRSLGPLWRSLCYRDHLPVPHRCRACHGSCGHRPPRPRPPIRGQYEVRASNISPHSSRPQQTVRHWTRDQSSRPAPCRPWSAGSCTSVLSQIVKIDRIRNIFGFWEMFEYLHMVCEWRQKWGSKSPAWGDPV